MENEVGIRLWIMCGVVDGKKNDKNPSLHSVVIVGGKNLNLLGACCSDVYYHLRGKLMF